MLEEIQPPNGSYGNNTANEPPKSPPTEQVIHPQDEPAPKVTIKIDKYILMFTALIIFHVSMFVVFQDKNKAFQTWDSAGHIELSFYMAHELKEVLAGNMSLLNFMKLSPYYPPLIQIMGAVVSVIFGTSSKLLLWFGPIFLIFALIYFYKLALYLSKSRDIAIFATIVLSFIPQVYDQMRLYHLEIPLIAFLLMAVYHVLRSDGFRHRNHSLLFFFAFACTQLIKWYGFIYLTVPVLTQLYLVFLRFKYDLPPPIKIKKIFWIPGVLNILIGSVMFSAIAFPWYIINFEKMLEFVQLFATPEIDDPQVFWSIENFAYYPRLLPSHQILLLPTILLVGGLVYLWFKERKAFWIVFASIMYPLAVFIYVKNKNIRYVMPLIPVFAYVISVFVIRYFKNPRKLKRFIFVYLLGAFFFISFNQVESGDSYLKIVGVVLSGSSNSVWYYDPTVYSYDPEHWAVDEVWQFIYDDAKPGKDEHIRVASLVDKEDFSVAMFNMVRRELDYTDLGLIIPYFVYEPFKSVEDIRKYLEEEQIMYAVVPEHPGPVGLRNFAVLQQISNYFVSPDNQEYQPLKKFSFPNWSAVVVYKRTGQNPPIGTNECTDIAGFADNVEIVNMEPNHTYVFFTGKFDVNGYSTDFEKGVFRILQIENPESSETIRVENLPVLGASFCNREGLGLDLLPEIKIPLTERGQCDVSCKKVVVTKWNTLTGEMVDSEYYRGEF